jgi:DNA repair protein RadC
MASTPSKTMTGYTGHRDRLRQRFMRGGKDALLDYELLELILCRAIPRRDVKPLAKALIGHFGSLSAVLGASKDRLSQVSGVSDRIICELKIVEAAALSVGQSKILGQPILASWQEVVSYCRTKIAEKSREEFHVIFLDKKNKIIADERMTQGTVDHTPVYPREIIKRALELEASALVLFHNHPSGDPAPSRADIEMTRKIMELAQGLSIRLHDHLIIGRSGDVSFKNLGLIP